MAWLEPFCEAIDWLRNLVCELWGSTPLRHLLRLALLVTVTGGIAEFLLDANVGTLLDGVWFAWVTLTHVGYGDIVPISLPGRLIGALLILLGFALFALFAATISAVLISRDFGGGVRRKAGERDEVLDELVCEMTRMRERLDAMEQKPGGR